MQNALTLVRSSLMPKRPSQQPPLPEFNLTDYVNTSEASLLLGIDQRSVSALAKGKRIRARKIGRDWWLLRSSLQTYLETKAPTGKKPGRPPRLKAEDE